MDYRAPVLGKELLQTPNPMHEIHHSARAEPHGLTLCLLPHPPFSSPSGLELSLSPSLHIFAGGANADVGTVLCSKYSADGPDRDLDLPFLPFVASRVNAPALTHACTHARRGTGEDKRALYPSAFVVATSEEGYIDSV